jgi:hypothetical protein
LYRRKADLKAVHTHDRTKLDHYDASWFIVDTRRINNWAVFVDGGTEPEVIRRSRGDPLPNLIFKIDYREDYPIVYYMLKEFHNQTRPEICRYECDIYTRKGKDADLINTTVIEPVLL